MNKDKEAVEKSDAWPVQRFTREVCRAVNNYSSEVQTKAISGFYKGKKLTTVIKEVKAK